MLIIIAIVLVSFTQAQSRVGIGKVDFSDWNGIAKVKNNCASMPNGDTISYTYANQNRTYFPNIGRNYYGDAADWTPYSGVCFDIYLKSDARTDVCAIFKVDSLDYDEQNPVSTAKIRLNGNGWHSVYIPWEMFEVDAGQKWGTLFAVKHFLITAQSKGNSIYQIRNVYLTKGRTLALESPIKGKSSHAGSLVYYELKVSNTTAEPQGVSLRIETEGWESMEAIIQPSLMDLEAGETKTCRLTVNIPAKLPAGIREKQLVKAISNGSGASLASMEFITAVRIPFPNIMFTVEGWQQVRDKVDKYDWAKESYMDYVGKADRWKPRKPAYLNEKEGVSILGKPILSEAESKNILNCAIAYQLTQNKIYAKKCIEYLRPLVDEKMGYPARLVGGSNSFVGEGKFWQATARAYDLIRTSEVLTESDHERFEKTFRLFVTRTIQGNTRGAISNWNVAEITAALYCALNLQDWYLIDHLLNSSTGVYKHLEHGIMNDGWWYECAVGYNTWVATEFSEIAIALQPWGINFKDRQFPMGTSKHFSLLASRRKSGIMGMEFEKWGNIERNSIGIKDMWDAAIPFVDFRGVLLAVNDALEGKLSGKDYELAYYLYRDPEYAAIVNRSEKRDLLYGVPDLPKVNSEKMKQSAYADNMGIVQLRSQTKNREQRDQIQAALHYGSHGGYHGHFDRTNLVSMMRYGRSFYGTLMYWYGYSSYLYKFLKQTSINKNMVVVDEKMQQPVENYRTLFHAGEMMQATVVETNSRWSYPPYGGGHDLEKAMWQEGRSIFIPEDVPDYGQCTGFTEPVMQRRLMLVMDDYVVLADYLEGEQEHQFDWTFNAKGFKGIEADKKVYLRHTNQRSTDPLGSAQFITDCDWWNVEGTSRTQFEMCWGEGCDNAGVRLPYSLEGPLKIDVFNAWPLKKDIMIAASNESFYVNKQLWYTVIADGNTLVSDSTGAWILGSRHVSLDIEGTNRLELTTRTPGKINNRTIFWGNAKVVLKDGSEIYLSSLPIKYENMALPAHEGKDYYNGPIKIQGELMEFSIPGMPMNDKVTGKIAVDLSGLDVVRFEAKIGSDYPMGDETSRLKNMAVRSAGSKARYLSVIEPYETESVIRSVTAESPDELRVVLTDGRIQNISISNMEGKNGQVKVAVTEIKDGQVIRKEESNEYRRD
ncbi:hypothetical protein [Saccharicrinis fermentans]|uniref:hypothetical protein n=1 Tax=Saccharicrinis fermentans TaxID=982 RepID=UPI0012692553|nr:hypothetical protein [Saccharicrinis fermentans]